MPLTKDKYFELIDSNSDYPHFRCALGAYIPGSYTNILVFLMTR